MEIAKQPARPDEGTGGQRSVEGGPVNVVELTVQCKIRAEHLHSGEVVHGQAGVLDDGLDAVEDGPDFLLQIRVEVPGSFHGSDLACDLEHVTDLHRAAGGKVRVLSPGPPWPMVRRDDCCELARLASTSEAATPRANDSPTGRETSRMCTFLSGMER